MKKGCFLTSIIVFTILLGTTFYIVDKYGDEILFFLKGRALELTAGTVDEYIEKLTVAEEKERLKKVWAEAYEKTRAMEFDEGMNYISSIINLVETYSKDSSLTIEEVNSIREFVENESK